MRKYWQKHVTRRGLFYSVILGIGLVLYSLLSLINISKSSIWFDEAFGAYIIRFNFFDIAKFTALDVHPPLYYWCLKVWSSIFGADELALRSMSILFGAVAISFLFLTVYRWVSRRAALAALGLLVISPFLIRYSQEARMYTMMAAIIFAATYVLLQALEQKKQRKLWGIYGVLVGLGMLTHYFAALAWVSHWVWRGIVVYRGGAKTKKRFRKAFFTKQWMFALKVALLVFAVWLPFFVFQLLVVQVGGFWIPPVTPDTPITFITTVLSYAEAKDIHSWLALLTIFVTIAFFVFARRAQKKPDQAPNLLLYMGALPAMLLFVGSMPPLQSSFADRYLVPSSLALVAFLAIGLASKRLGKTWRVNIALYASVVLLMLVGIGNVYKYGNYNVIVGTDNNTRQLLEKVWQRAKPGEPIIAASPWVYYEASFYSSDDHPVYFIDAKTEYIYGSMEMLKQSDMGKIKDLNVFSKQHPRVWYVGYPQANNLESPDKTWEQLQTLRQDDKVTGKQSYQAIEYATSSAE